MKENIYLYRELPWMSKSTILTEAFCPWLFYLKYIKKDQRESSRSGRIGISMHAAYEYFFERVDIKKLEQIPVEYEEDITATRLYEFMYSTAMEFVPFESRSFEPYQIMIGNFAVIEAEHWVKLNELFNGNISKVLKYWIPIEAETFYEFPEAFLFGTIDRKNKTFVNPKRDIIEIYDYKTGHVPKQVKEGLKYPDDPYSWSLPRNKMFELHFYVLLDIVNRGFKLNDKIIDFLTKNKFFTKDVKVPKVKSYFLNKKGEKYNWKDDYRIGIIYTGSELGPFVAKKFVNRRSMAAVFRRVNKLRGKVYRNEPFEKDINYFRCSRCGLLKQCLNETELELLHLNDEEEDV